MTESAREAKPSSVPPPAAAKADQKPLSQLPDQMSRSAVDHAAHSARSGWNLAHPTVIELMDDVVGQHAHHDVPIFALDSGQQGPRVIAKIQGDPAIRLVQVPMYLGGTVSFDPSAVFKLDFVPQRAGFHDATLEIDILDEPKQHVRIPIRAWSREPGGKTRAQTLAAEEQARTDAANREASAAARADAEARIARRDQQPEDPHHAGNRAQLDRKRGDVAAKMLDLSEKRKNGIRFASDNIGAFKRQQPVPEQPSLLGRLAWSALDMVTAGMARNVSNALKEPLEHLLTTTITARDPDVPMMGLTTTVVPHSAALVGILTEGVRSGVKLIGGALKPEKSDKPGADPDHVEGVSSLDAKAAFISAQTDAVTGDSHQVAEATSRFVFDSLLDTLDVAPKAALAVMDTMREGLQHAFSDAIEAQRAETFRNWLRYLTQTSVGTSSKRKAEDGSDVTNIERATALADEGPAKTFDGIVDVTIQIDERNPQAPVIPKSAMIRGVANNVVQTLRSRPLLEARVPVRAVAEPSARSATASLSVVRDEAGNLAYEDRVTGSDVQPSRWLSRKAGIVPGSEGGQREGARILMENEVMTKRLGDNLKTDSET